MRENWKHLHFWAWWWRNRVQTEVKVGVAAVIGALLIIGGYFASGSLTGADAASTGSVSYVLQTTVTKVVTVNHQGKTVVKRIPVVVRRRVVKSSTAFETLTNTRVVTSPGGVRYLTRKVVRYVPVVKRKVVHVNGKTTTLTETRLVPTVKTQTLTNVVTNNQTVTNENTVVVNRTNTLVQPVTTVQTKTQTLPPNTVTLPPNTVTLPPVTVTDQQTVTDSVTNTVTSTVTQTVTVPAITVTITVP